MITRSTVTLLSLACTLAALTSAGAQTAKKEPDWKPHFADVRYGPHERNVLDLWVPNRSRPAPLVLFFHGGGFRQGDKSRISANTVRQYLAAGWAFAAINYRLTDSAPAPAAYLDSARALQYLRHHAAQWNLEPKRVASTGSSAGAGISLWLAFHDDLAEPGSTDPVARQSTRLVCAVVNNGQSSYDPRFAEKIGLPRPNFERHQFFLPFYDLRADEIDTPKAYARYEAAAPITYLTRDDPPVLLHYGYANETVTAATSLNVVVHHPRFGLALKQAMDQLGIACIVQYQKVPGGDLVQEPPAAGQEVVSTIDFIRKHFEKVP